MASDGEKSGNRECGVVSPRGFTLSQAVIGRTLATPWKRLLSILLDMVVVAVLSLLSGPWLGLATGAMLIVLFGNDPEAPIPKKAVRWACRAMGAIVIVLSVLALGHLPLLKERGLQIDALTGFEPSQAQREVIVLPPNATNGEVRTVVDRLQHQVEELKKDNETQRKTAGSWLGQTRTLAGALGVTFGWSGVYFTLLAGSWHGRTLGKVLFGIQALKTDGSAFTYFDAFVRHGGYVAGVAMGMTGFLKLLWDPNRQAVEDRIAGTVVVCVTGQATA